LDGIFNRLIILDVARLGFDAGSHSGEVCKGGTRAVKIGVSGLGYQCGEHLNEVLQPWFDLKISPTHEVLISVAHGIFPELYAISQRDPEPPDGSIASLQEYLADGRLDALFVSPEPKYEWDLRTCTLPVLVERQIDLLWLLDLQDEIYSVREILSIIDFVESHQGMIWFRVNFKNYAFAPNCYVEDFVVPRIWRARKPSTIRCFHYDNSITYEDGQKQESLPHCTIPRNLAFPRHLSWVGTPQYLKRKIRFQNIHYGICSYKWDEERNCLQFNEDYYLRFKKQKPEVHRESECQ